MSEILVNTIKKADGTGSITVPANTGTLVDTSGADFTDQVTVTKTSAGASTNGLIVKNTDNTAGTAASIGFAAHGSGVETHRVEAAVDGANSYSMRFYTYQSGLNERMRINADGNLCLGTTSTGGDMVKLNNTTSSGWLVNFNNSNATNKILISSQSGTGAVIHHQFNNSNGLVGKIETSGSSTTYATSSDYRLKENVVDMTGAINRVKALKPSQFNFIADSDDTTVDGFLAHEVQTVVPEAVTGTHNQVEVWAEGEELPEGVSVGDNKLDEDGNTIPVYQGIDQSKLVPLLTGALQEAIAKIETLETTVADLQTRVTALENA